MSSSSLQPNHVLHSQFCQAKAMATLGYPLEGRPRDGPPGAVDDVVDVSKGGAAAGRAAGSGLEKDRVAKEEDYEERPSWAKETIEEVVVDISGGVVAAVLVEDGPGGSPDEGLDIGAELWARSWASIPGYKLTDEEPGVVPTRTVEQEGLENVGAEEAGGVTSASASSWSREGGQGFPEITHLYADDVVVPASELGGEDPSMEAVWARYVRRRGEPEGGEVSSTPGIDAEVVAQFHDRRLQESRGARPACRSGT